MRFVFPNHTDRERNTLAHNARRLVFVRVCVCLYVYICTLNVCMYCTNESPVLAKRVRSRCDAIKVPATNKTSSNRGALYAMLWRKGLLAAGLLYARQTRAHAKHDTTTRATSYALTAHAHLAHHGRKWGSQATRTTTTVVMNSRTTQHRTHNNIYLVHATQIKSSNASVV